MVGFVESEDDCVLLALLCGCDYFFNSVSNIFDFWFAVDAVEHWCEVDIVRVVGRDFTSPVIAPANTESIYEPC